MRVRSPTRGRSSYTLRRATQVCDRVSARPVEGRNLRHDSFIGTAHALRKDLFLRLGGYREHLRSPRGGEISAIRMLEAGYVVRLGSADPIHHLDSPRRDFGRMDYYGRRNDILFAWHNVPMPYFPIHLLGTTLNGFASAIRVRRFQKMLEGMARGYADCFQWWTDRCAVPRKVYRLHRLLRKQGPQRLLDIEPILPQLQATHWGDGHRVLAEMTWIVAQLGARMHYAVPRILHADGLLEHFFTDICANKGWPRMLQFIPPKLRPVTVARLLSRVPENIPTNRITAFTDLGFEYSRRLRQLKSPSDATAVFLWNDSEFCRRVNASPWGEASAVFTFNNAGLEILQLACARRLITVMEQTIAPCEVERRLLDEQQAEPRLARTVCRQLIDTIQRTPASRMGDSQPNHLRFRFRA